MTDRSLAQPAAPPVARTDTRGHAVPRWHSHAYNRAELYRLAAAMGWLPRPARLGLARAVGRAARRLFPAEGAVIHDTLAVMTGATGARLDELTVGVFRDFAMCFSDLVTTNRHPTAQLSAYVSRTRSTERLDELKGGMISLTAHVGNWEMAGRLLAVRSARPTHVVVAPEEIRALERWVRRDGDGVRFVPRTAPTVSLQLVAALRRGEVVAVQGDRALGTRGDALVPFFGRPAPFPLGPFILARALRVPLAPAFCMLGSDYRYTVTMPEPLHVRAGGEEEALRVWVARLEETVRAHPTQWFNFFDVWNPPLG
ncbi:MAG TPA: lysophospholipid acyltransferase family protein [Verrucomicrobiae bacterium]|jgi:Kdo2-lipid IVA lauroyltransferase/acyltransferase|nr:lysophospholipid acyltransferase family protein [Verrucomicrobiae bacterium]